MRNGVLASVAILTSVIFVACSQSQATTEAKVIRISDGDTVVVEELPNHQREKIRVWGIDTPEKFASEKLYREAKKCHTTPERIRYLGKLASKHAHSYLSEGEIVEVEKLGKGHYGRVIGKIILPNGWDYGYRMVEDGYACVYWKSTSEEYIKAMEEAKENHRGLWEVDYELMKCLCY